MASFAKKMRNAVKAAADRTEDSTNEGVINIGDNNRTDWVNDHQDDHDDDRD
ncbi:hypothetical protein [Nocardiopsis potens]|uniref:hypothetical protein n=1 Tax=Nocardiopsis potens TaxID=1246458 RepID=UPI000347A94F|nr:hypothetical protein [Nocardiopsis potens]